MAATWGRFSDATHPQIDKHVKIYQCAKFGASIPKCTIFPIFDP
jgi:hypothetical protein